MHQLEQRRTIRRYSSRPVSEELLTRLFSLAGRTQTMGNLQLYSVVVTRSNEIKAQLAPAHFNQPMVMGAPVVITVCADYRRTTIWANQRKAHPGYDNFLSFMNAATDALLFTQTFSNLAEEEGLGLCFLGTTIYNAQQIIDVLNLPSLVVPVATLTVGYPDEEGVLSERLPVESFVHQETYHDYTAADIDRYYEEKESLEVNRGFVRENGKETLAQVFTDVRYTKKDCEAMSATLLEVLRHQGFLQ